MSAPEVCPDRGTRALTRLPRELLIEPRRLEYLPLDELIPATRNPKRHRPAALRTSIARFGFASPALRDERTGRLVVGHGRTEALTAMRDEGEDPPAGVRVDGQGRWLVPVVCGWASRSDAEAEAYLVADNRHTELGGWDPQELTELLSGLQGVDPDLLDATGYDEHDLEDLLKANTPADLDTLADELGEPDPADMWPVIRLRVPPHVAAAWRSYADTYNQQEVIAFAALLEVDPEPPPAADWQP